MRGRLQVRSAGPLHIELLRMPAHTDAPPSPSSNFPPSLSLLYHPSLPPFLPLLQHGVPIFSLPREWLWCETWCGSDSRPQVCCIAVLCCAALRCAVLRCALLLGISKGSGLRQSLLLHPAPVGCLLLATAFPGTRPPKPHIPPPPPPITNPPIPPPGQDHRPLQQPAHQGAQAGCCTPHHRRVAGPEPGSRRVHGSGGEGAGGWAEGCTAALGCALSASRLPTCLLHLLPPGCFAPVFPKRLLRLELLECAIRFWFATAHLP